MLFNMGSADAAPVIEKAVADKFIMALQAVDNGPLTTCQDEALAEMVETSSNVASVITDENSIHIVASQRSNVMSNLDNMTNTVKAAFLLAGAEVNVGGKYPAWKMRANSKYYLTITRDGIVHLAAVEANQTEFSVQLFVLQEEETGEYLDGVGTLLIDVIARVATVESLQGCFQEEIASRSFFTIEVECCLGGLTACA